MLATRKGPNRLILAGDIGGTNVNLALIEFREGRFSLLFDRHYKTRQESSLISPLGRFLEEARREIPDRKPEFCCISGAGPVVDDTIELTNAPWGIDGPGIEAAFGIPTRVINDFTAVSYGVVLLDPENPGELLRLRHGDGADPRPDGGVKLVVGAGTGLGVGYLARIGEVFRAFPSEGGHITLPVYDEESRALQRWLEERYGFVPGAEAAVSGQGIEAICDFLARSMEVGKEARRILEAPKPERPALIAAAAAASPADPLCARTMEVFVKCYARVAADLGAAFIPTGGLYLAGGIAAKNEARFLEGNRFMECFERSYREHIRAILARIPVMIVRDYSISLYGAANAAVLLADD